MLMIRGQYTIASAWTLLMLNPQHLWLLGSVPDSVVLHPINHITYGHVRNSIISFFWIAYRSNMSIRLVFQDFSFPDLTKSIVLTCENSFTLPISKIFIRRNTPGKSLLEWWSSLLWVLRTQRSCPFRWKLSLWGTWQTWSKASRKHENPCSGWWARLNGLKVG